MMMRQRNNLVHATFSCGQMRWWFLGGKGEGVVGRKGSHKLWIKDPSHHSQIIQLHCPQLWHHAARTQQGEETTQRKEGDNEGSITCYQIIKQSARRGLTSHILRAGMMLIFPVIVKLSHTFLSHHVRSKFKTTCFWRGSKKGENFINDAQLFPYLRPSKERKSF